MQELIKRTLPQDDALNQAIVNELRSQNWAGFLNYSQVQQLCHNFELTPLKLAMHLLPLAASYSHTAISHFNVGQLLLANKGIFISARIKNLLIQPFSKRFTRNKVQFLTLGCVMNAVFQIWWSITRRADIVVNL